MSHGGERSFGIGSQLLATNVPSQDVITYLGWEICAISPRDGLGPYLVKLSDLQEPRTYRRDDPHLQTSRRPSSMDSNLYVYTNHVHGTTRIHRAVCSHCNWGKGTHGVEETPTGE